MVRPIPGHANIVSRTTVPPSRLANCRPLMVIVGISALRALQARRVALVSPYSPTVSENARAYLHSGHGFDVTAVEGLNITDPGTITGLDAGPITSALARAAISKPDVFIVAGGAFHGMRYIDAWEEQFGRPVITTNIYIDKNVKPNQLVKSMLCASVAATFPQQSGADYRKQSH